jgi:nucleotide-binding universal stress UspA family protein
MRILIAVSLEADDSPDVVAAVKSFAWPPEAVFRVVTAAPYVHPSAPELMISATTVPEVQQKVNLRAENISATAAVRLREAGMNADSISAEGDPKTMIISEATRWAADLIVVGSSGRSRLERWVLGSVSRAVVTDARVSVLVIKNATAEA